LQWNIVPYGALRACEHPFLTVRVPDAGLQFPASLVITLLMWGCGHEDLQCAIAFHSLMVFGCLPDLLSRTN